LNGHSGYYRQQDSRTTANRERIRLQEYTGKADLEAGNSTKVTIVEDKNWVDRVGDSESEEGILPYQGVKSKGILRMTEVTVQ